MSCRNSQFFLAGFSRARFPLMVLVLVLLGWVIHGAVPALAAGIVSTDPITNEVGVDPDADIVAAYSAAINPSTVTTRTFAAQGMVSGLREGMFSFGGGDTIVTLDPDDDYFAGEVIRVSATGGISDALGAPVTPYQWQFTAGPVTDRCAGGFSRVNAGLTGVGLGSADWGDYDGDGDLDILLTGMTTGGARVSEIWRNEGDGTFSDQTPAGLTGVQQSAAAWGDYDNDGDLDILLTGWDTGTDRVSQLWRNDGSGGFTDQTPAGLTPVNDGAVAWGDYDNDGHLDILLSGCTSGALPCAGRVTEVWRNDGSGSFARDAAAGLPGLTDSAVAWGDHDNDGDLDIFLSGLGSAGYLSQVWRNNGDETFSNIGAGLTAVGYGDAAWGDYDRDGDLDILLSGYTGLVPVSQVWRNNGNGSFSNIGAGLAGVNDSSTAWGDYDNDGDLDILLTGDYWDGTRYYVTNVYRNDGGAFVNIQAALSKVSGAAGWGDYDSDGDLDILLAGYINNSVRVSQIWRNDDCTDLALAKRVNVATVTPGQAITYTIVFTNYGPGPTHGVTLTDIVPAELQDVSYTRSGAPITPTGAVSYTWQVADLGVGEGGTVTLTGRARVDLPACGAFTNTAKIDSHLDITRSDNQAGVRVSLPFHVAATDPTTNEVGVDRSADIQATFDAAVAAGTVNTGTFASHAMMGGLLTGTYDTTGDTVTLDPSRTLFAGEVVRTTLGSGLECAGGGQLVPYQWQFTAGPVFPRCLGGFTDIGAGLPGMQNSSVAWGDYDNDGDLDLLLSGTVSGGPVTQVWRNAGGTFADLGAGLSSLGNGAAAWGDYDNDGDLDILLTGWTKFGITMSQVWRNDGGTFADIGAALIGLYGGGAAWGDYDNDGDLDIALTGWDDNYNSVSRVYRNDGGTFTNIHAGLSQVYEGSVEWGDYDSDGDLDILLTGQVDFPERFVAEVWRNDGGTFTDIGAGLPGVRYGTAAWGDYDTDGDLDILLTGMSASGRMSRLYRNDDCAVLGIAKQAEPVVDVPHYGVVTYTVALSNAGGPAYGVTMSDTLPPEVDFGGWVGGSHNAAEAGGTISWTGTVSAGTAITWTWRVTHTGGYGDVVENTAHYSHTTGSRSAAAAFWVTSTLPLYLPVIYKGFVDLPDLVVTGLSASTSEIRVTIQNVGGRAATDNFWVDVSFDPRVQPPRINQPWYSIASAGAAWGVTKDLDAGESLELVTGGDYYFGPPVSSVPPWPSGATVWAYVDSVYWATTWGAVREIDENNNTRSTVSAAGDESQALPLSGARETAGLPAR